MPSLSLPDPLLDRLRDLGGVRAGHTVFRNGFHGDGWLEKGVLIRRPDLLDEVARRQAESVRAHFPQTDVLVGASQCGAVLTGFVARHLGAQFAFTSSVGELAFHRMFVPEAGRKAVFVDDLICSGADLRAHAAFLRAASMTPLGASCWVNRQAGEVAGVRVVPLMPAPFHLYMPGACPLCREGVPVQYQNVRE